MPFLPGSVVVSSTRRVAIELRVIIASVIMTALAKVILLAGLTAAQTRVQSQWGQCKLIQSASVLSSRLLTTA